MVLIVNTALFILAVKPNLTLIIFSPPSKYFVYLQLVLSCLFHPQNSSGQVTVVETVGEQRCEGLLVHQQNQEICGLLIFDVEYLTLLCSRETAFQNSGTAVVGVSLMGKEMVPSMSLPIGVALM
jgi:hypothetical protein